MMLPTEPVGSMPPPADVVVASRAIEAGTMTELQAEPVYAAAVRDTVLRFIEIGSPVVPDAGQRPTRPVLSLGAVGSSGGGRRRHVEASRDSVLPPTVRGPLYYADYADRFVRELRRETALPIKQSLVAPSTLSLLYPAEPLPGYTREAFLADLVEEHAKEVRLCFAAGAHFVQLDFAEVGLALTLDPSGVLLESLIDLNNLALRRFGPSLRARIGVHACPVDETGVRHGAAIDYARLLPSLFRLDAGRFFVALAGEADRAGMLALIRDNIQRDQTVFVGVVDPAAAHLDTAEEVCERVLEAAAFVSPDQLGTTDDCGFASFCQASEAGRDIAFARMRARIEGTRMAAERLGLA